MGVPRATSPSARAPAAEEPTAMTAHGSSDRNADARRSNPSTCPAQVRV